MTPKAAVAFGDYVGMGPSRTIRGLAAAYVEQHRYKTRSTAANILNAWSVEYDWQARIAEAVTDRTMRLLAEASELDADTFLAISREYRRRTTAPIEREPLDGINSIRDRVKVAASKAPSLTINLVIRQEAERLAGELGITAADLLADAERIAAAAWGEG